MTRPEWARVAHEWPPGPCPPFWRAWDDRLGEDDSPYGEGATADEAVADLIEQLEKRECKT